MVGIRKITLEEVDVLINYYLDLAEKLGPTNKRINGIKIRLGHWTKVKNQLEKEE